MLPLGSTQQTRWRYELRWFLLGYGLPFLVLYGLALFASHSGLPLWRRALTGEDACAYFVCFIVPLVPYGIVRAVGPLIEYLQWRRKQR